MNLLEELFLFGPVIGFALCLFILCKKDGIGNYKKAKLALVALVFIYAVYVLDNFLVFKGHVFELSGTPYILYHTVGFLLYYFITEITGEKSKVKFWTKVLIGLSAIRMVFLTYVATNYSYILYDVFELKSEPIWIWLALDNLIVVSVNLGLILKAYQLFKNTPLVIAFGKKGEMQYRWVNLMFMTNIVIMALSFVNILLGGLDLYTIQFSIQFDLVIYSLFFFVLVYSLMSFPVFAFTGHFKDLEPEVKQKYKKSSLQDSQDVFFKIDELIKEEQLYLDSNLKLNTVAERMELSLPHISQAINQNTQMSFSDYINGFRIEEAKVKLLEENPDKIIAIAFDVGFNSKATFYNAFKKVTNTTPTNFKKAQQVKSL